MKMFHRSFKKLTPQNWMVVPKAKFRNYVMSDVLAQIEKDCDRCCPVPRVPPRKVCVHFTVMKLLDSSKFFDRVIFYELSNRSGDNSRGGQ